MHWILYKIMIPVFFIERIRMFYLNAPLPFCGQKRYCVKKFIEILDNYPIKKNAIIFIL